MTKDFENKIRNICTYWSEDKDGTAGYLLSEEQFQKLFDLIDEEIGKAFIAGKED